MAVHTFNRAYNAPLTKTFAETYCSRGLSYALARQVMYLFRSEESEVYTWQQFIRRPLAMAGMLPFAAMAIVESVARVALSVGFFFLHWVPYTNRHYDREGPDLACKSISNIFMIVLQAFMQLAMTVPEMK